MEEQIKTNPHKPTKGVMLLFLFLLLLLIPAGAFCAESLKVILMVSTGKQRTVFVDIIRQFEKENPGIKVQHWEVEQKPYKKQIHSWLESKQSNSDVLLWFAGNSLKSFVEKGLVEPTDEVLAGHGLDKKFSKASMSAITFDGKAYGLPMSYYQWGFYYSKSLFKQHILTPPETWEDLLNICKTLKSNNITPFTLGSKNKWPAMGWFDYLNLRINGLEFHMDLMNGKASYTDERLKKVFSHWALLLKKGYFLKDHSDNDWRTALPYLYRKKAGMLLMGNFLIPKLPDMVLPDIGFFRFPSIEPNVPFFEEAPLDILIVPKNAANKNNAMKFLAFAGRADIQADMNSRMSMISPNMDAGINSDYYIQQGAEVLEQAEGSSQFFDRDTPPEMVPHGMEAIAKFLKYPDKITSILKDLDESIKKQKELSAAKP